MHLVFVYTEAEMHILHVIQLILLFPFVCEAVGEVERKIEYVHRNNLPGLIVSLDQTEDYDRVECNFLFKVL